MIDFQMVFQRNQAIFKCTKEFCLIKIRNEQANRYILNGNGRCDSERTKKQQQRTFQRKSLKLHCDKIVW